MKVCGDVVDDYTVHSTLMCSDDVTSAIKKLNGLETQTQFDLYYLHGSIVNTNVHKQ